MTNYSSARHGSESEVTVQRLHSRARRDGRRGKLGRHRSIAESWDSVCHENQFGTCLFCASLGHHDFLMCRAVG